MNASLVFPFDPNYLLRKKRAIRNELLANEDLKEKRIAVLGGSTTSEVKDMLELFLLNEGFRPVFYESGFNRYFEDVMFNNFELKDFAPEIIYVHSSNVNVSRYPSGNESDQTVRNMVLDEVNRYKRLWDQIVADFSCPIIQNNFELPYYRLLGNLDCYDIHGRTHFITSLNFHFSEEARQRPGLHLHDINYLSSWFGLERWYNKLFWYSYKYAMNIEAIPYIAQNVASIIRVIFGRTRKCLVLDLDNTLWGGVIGDDGLNGIKIGKGTPEAEAYFEFQEYLKLLKDRGVILAICSKNDDANARQGFSHPDSVLELSDFSDFRANWNPKHKNIREICDALNIGIDSVVFADDNPVERDMVRTQEPQVAVPELGNDVTKYIAVLDKSGYFETLSVSAEDLQRNLYYNVNTVRNNSQNKYETYDEFLQSLAMVAEIKCFAPVYFDRITQLTNKTNQFNLTTRRYTQIEIEQLAKNKNFIKLYGRLEDRFGDYGVIALIIGATRGKEIHIDLWLMSCRVIKRGMEFAMFDEFVAHAKSINVDTIIGYYYPTNKNSVVANIFNEMGFSKAIEDDIHKSEWRLNIKDGYENKNKLIKVSR